MNAYEKVAANLDTFAKDCAVTVALKISDDSCIGTDGYYIGLLVKINRPMVI